MYFVFVVSSLSKGKSMMRKADKIEKYLETRLWHSKKAGQTITARQLMHEIHIYYRIGLDKPNVSDSISTLIGKVRNRVDNRIYHWKRKRKRWADLLGLPEDLVEKWRREGIITDKRSVKKIAVVLKDLRNSSGSSE